MTDTERSTSVDLQELSDDIFDVSSETEEMSDSEIARLSGKKEHRDMSASSEDEVQVRGAGAGADTSASGEDDFSDVSSEDIEKEVEASASKITSCFEKVGIPEQEFTPTRLEVTKVDMKKIEASSELNQQRKKLLKYYICKHPTYTEEKKSVLYDAVENDNIRPILNDYNDLKKSYFLIHDGYKHVKGSLVQSERYRDANYILKADVGKLSSIAKEAREYLYNTYVTISQVERIQKPQITFPPSYKSDAVDIHIISEKEFMICGNFSEYNTKFTEIGGKYQSSDPGCWVIPIESLDLVRNLYKDKLSKKIFMVTEGETTSNVRLYGDWRRLSPKLEALKLEGMKKEKTYLRIGEITQSQKEAISKIVRSTQAPLLFFQDGDQLYICNVGTELNNTLQEKGVFFSPLFMDFSNQNPNTKGFPVEPRKKQPTTGTYKRFTRSDENFQILVNSGWKYVAPLFESVQIKTRFGNYTSNCYTASTKVEGILDAAVDIMIDTGSYTIPEKIKVERINIKKSVLPAMMSDKPIVIQPFVVPTSQKDDKILNMIMSRMGGDRPKTHIQQQPAKKHNIDYLPIDIYNSVIRSFETQHTPGSNLEIEIRINDTQPENYSIASEFELMPEYKAGVVVSDTVTSHRTSPKQKVRSISGDDFDTKYETKDVVSLVKYEHLGYRVGVSIESPISELQFNDLTSNSKESVTRNRVRTSFLSETKTHQVDITVIDGGDCEVEIEILSSKIERNELLYIISKIIQLVKGSHNSPEVIKKKVLASLGLGEKLLNPIKPKNLKMAEFINCSSGITNSAISVKYDGRYAFLHTLADKSTYIIMSANEIVRIHPIKLSFPVGRIVVGEIVNKTFYIFGVYDKNNRNFDVGVIGLYESIFHEQPPRKEGVQLLTPPRRVDCASGWAVEFKEFYVGGTLYERIGKAQKHRRSLNASKKIREDGLIIQNTSDIFDVKKWKPASLMTIDFKLNKDNKGHWFLTTTHGVPTFTKNYYLDTSEILRFKDVRIGNIVECLYNPDNKNWKIIRLRKDRRFPNSPETANSVWNDIISPFAESTLLGLDNVLMRKKHMSVKDFLIDSVNVKGKSILDAGAGAGGLMGLWEKYKPNIVYSVEPNPRNFEELERRSRKFSDKRINFNLGAEEILKNTGFLTKEGTPVMFDVLSMFFVLTFFGSISGIKIINEIMTKFIKPGGYFIGIVNDGTVVAKNLIENGGAWIGQNSNGGEMWKFTKDQNSKMTYNPQDLENFYKTSPKEMLDTIGSHNLASTKSTNKVNITFSGSDIVNYTEDLFSFEALYYSLCVSEKGGKPATLKRTGFIDYPEFDMNCLPKHSIEYSRTCRYFIFQKN